MSVRLCCVSVIGLCYLYTVHFTAFLLGGPFFPGHGVDRYSVSVCTMILCLDDDKLVHVHLHNS